MSREWTTWTGSGLYDSSPGGDLLFGFHLNLSRNQPSRFVQARQLRSALRRPDLVSSMLQHGSLSQSIEAMTGTSVSSDMTPYLAAAVLSLPSVQITEVEYDSSAPEIEVHAEVKFPEFQKQEFYVSPTMDGMIGYELEDAESLADKSRYVWRIRYNKASRAGKVRQLQVQATQQRVGTDAPYGQDSRYIILP